MKATVIVHLKNAGILDFEIEAEELPEPAQLIDRIIEDGYVVTSDDGYVTFDKREASGMKIIPLDEPVETFHFRECLKRASDMLRALNGIVTTTCGNCKTQNMLISEDDGSNYQGFCSCCNAELAVKLS